MTSTANSILKRYAIVIPLSVLIFGSLRLLPRGYMPPWQAGAVVFFLAILWANSAIIRGEHPVWAILVSILLVPALGLPVAFGSLLAGRPMVELRYRLQGYQMVEGCNAGAAVGTDGELHEFEQRMEWLSYGPEVNTNLVAQVKEAQTIAKEKAKVLSEDCGRRGHCDTYPWKTNWAKIKKALDAEKEELNRQE